MKKEISNHHWCVRASLLTGFCAFAVTGLAATLDATFHSASDVPLSTNSYTATGNMVSFTLNFVPETGTRLTVLNNTGLGFIEGTFSNLSNGQPVILSFDGAAYPFITDYHGGDGNDLVLVWSDQRVYGCGLNYYGALGDGTTTSRLLPMPVATNGLLFGKTVLNIAAGERHSLALCSDGTLVAWGDNTDGRLGDGGLINWLVPVAVNLSANSAIFDKRVVAIAAGSEHSMALCSDGTVTTWGGNGSGQLGFNSVNRRLIPIAVINTTPASALYGKTVVAIAAGGRHSLALCSDGTVAAWGYNAHGQLGDGTSGTNRLMPVAVNTSSNSALFGKSVRAIAAGQDYSLALCSDGTAIAWGNNAYGQLGDNSIGTNRLFPVAVNTSPGISALFAKEVVAIEAGTQHSVALCSDGLVAAWGRNDYGQIGDNSLSIRDVPVEVNAQTGSALFGKAVIRIGSGDEHSLALCSDGTAAAWGYNPNGQVGDNSTSLYRQAPVRMSTNAIPAGARFIHVSDGPVSYHTLTLVASPLTLKPEIHVTGNGVPIPNGDTTPGMEDQTDFGVVAVDDTSVRTYTISNIGTASLNLTGSPKVAISGAHAADFVVTTQPASPIPFNGNTTFQVTFQPSGGFSRYATVTIANNDTDENPFTFDILGLGFTMNELEASYTNGMESPLVAGEFTATSNTVRFALSYAPPPGTELMVVRNTGLGFINGHFENLTNGQPVELNFDGVTYDFVANYYGGTGNDLVLVWAHNRAFAWGNNWMGAVGDGTMDNRYSPVPVNASSVLARKTLVDLAAGRDHNVALCSDGTVTAWGWNADGQIGDNSAMNRLEPVLVDTTTNSALFGKRVIAVAAGNKHSMALCSDGTVAAWGFNGDGQLGDNTSSDQFLPVGVDMSTNSALYGKTVVAITAGRYQSAALCSDGTVACWGLNDEGQLGNNSTNLNLSRVPVAVNTGTNSALFGKTVVAISSGLSHTLALCSDGTMAAWGQNTSAQLGNNFVGLAQRSPVAVKMNVAALSGKTVSSIAAGRRHSAALCDDGSVVTWGDNGFGELGTNVYNARIPIAVNVKSNVSALHGRSVIELTAGYGNTLALCSDGTLTAWGLNDSGQIGNKGMTNCYVPVMVSQSSLAAGERFVKIYKGSMSYHTLALAASPLPPLEIQMRAEGGVVRFEWPRNYSGFIAQANFDLGNTNGWFNLTNTPVWTETSMVLTLPIHEGSCYLRLRSP